MHCADGVGLKEDPKAPDAEVFAEFERMAGSPPMPVSRQEIAHAVLLTGVRFLSIEQACAMAVVQEQNLSPATVSAKLLEIAHISNPERHGDQDDVVRHVLKVVQTFSGCILPHVALLQSLISHGHTAVADLTFWYETPCDLPTCVLRSKERPLHIDSVKLFNGIVASSSFMQQVEDEAVHKTVALKLLFAWRLRQGKFSTEDLVQLCRIFAGLKDS